MADIFVQQEQTILPLPILIKLGSATNLSNSFLLFELCRTFIGLENWGFVMSYPMGLLDTSPFHLTLLMTYLADYLDNQHRLGQEVLLPDDYLSASLRCLWYLQSSSW